MEKRISYSQFQQVKCVAKAIDTPKRKMEPIRKKIEKLAEEYKNHQAEIDTLEMGIVNTLGFHVSDLVKKVIIHGVDGKGNATTTTKYLPTDIVTYDEQHKQFVITTPDEGENAPEAVAPTTADCLGSDFDADRQAADEPVF